MIKVASKKSIISALILIPTIGALALTCVWGFGAAPSREDIDGKANQVVKADTYFLKAEKIQKDIIEGIKENCPGDKNALVSNFNKEDYRNNFDYNFNKYFGKTDYFSTFSVLIKNDGTCFNNDGKNAEAIIIDALETNDLTAFKTTGNFAIQNHKEMFRVTGTDGRTFDIIARADKDYVSFMASFVIEDVKLSQVPSKQLTFKLLGLKLPDDSTPGYVEFVL